MLMATGWMQVAYVSDNLLEKTGVDDTTPVFNLSCFYYQTNAFILGAFVIKYTLYICGQLGTPRNSRLQRRAIDEIY